MPIRRQAIIWTNDGLDWWRIYASLHLNELNKYQGYLICMIISEWFIHKICMHPWDVYCVDILCLVCDEGISAVKSFIDFSSLSWFCVGVKDTLYYSNAIHVSLIDVHFIFAMYIYIHTWYTCICIHIVVSSVRVIGQNVILHLYMCIECSLLSEHNPPCLRCWGGFHHWNLKTLHNPMVCARSFKSGV